MIDLLGILTEWATPVGVVFAASQLFISQRQARTTFEDQLSTQYREIGRRLPIGALLGDTLAEPDIVSALPEFFHYFDLCNEQAYLRTEKKVRKSTWREWEEGIRQNLRRPAFARAWEIIAAKVPDSFDELRAVSPPKGSVVPTY